ncbi:RNase A-like domain-containing protein [uncultured Tenacibaculum sp.]|uniref:RNase A-like domain-containing protein n=1 Tax=uncultured Tenacibaculum sp. TaxID=174713 RepID=UPI0026026AAC|nr:RNase A-like domain-containing protein [uncultured Tenacibaculum sp.]
MKKIILYIIFLLATQLSFTQSNANRTLNLINNDCPILRNLIDEININPQLKNAIGEDPDLIIAWKKLDDLEADEFFKKDPKILDYVQNGRNNEINIDVEELLGGHSKARHGAHLTDNDMRLRALGQHPNFPQSRSALKFDSDLIHKDAVNKAYRHHKNTIETHFNSSDDYLTLEYNYGSKVGSGYTNIGTRNSPISSPVETNKIVIALKRDTTNPDGYILDSAYPNL